VLGGDAGKRSFELQIGVDPDTVGEAHRGPTPTFAAAVSEDAQSNVGRERGVGAAAGGAEEACDLV